MTIHKEGFIIILIAFLGLGALNALFYYLLSEWMWIVYVLGAASLVFFFLIVQFFRMPKRNPVIDANKIIAPSDGKVVVIEEIEEPEFFNGEKRIQLSIFMSPLNVHAQWYPIPGFVKYYKYHPGKYLVAWHPKSSTENERSTIVVESTSGNKVLFRQIAGAVARRIKWYVKEDQKINQGQEYGFIKFGSRLDVFLPVDAEINVNIGDVTKGGRTVIATLK